MAVVLDDEELDSLVDAELQSHATVDAMACGLAWNCSKAETAANLSVEGEADLSGEAVEELLAVEESLRH